MRLNKKRLAALAMSAVMAASAIPFPAYAEDLSAGDVAVAAEAVAETPAVGETTQYPIDTAGVELDEVTGDVTKVVIHFKVGEPLTITDPAKIAKVATVTNFKKKTCTEVASADVLVTYNRTSVKVPWSGTTKADHTYTANPVWHQTEAPTCDKDGVNTKFDVCAVCGHEEKTSTTEAIPKKHADWTEGIATELKEGTNTQKVNGEIVLKDPTKDGDYTVVYTCPLCKKEALKEKITIKATQAVEDVVVVAEKTGVHAYSNITDAGIEYLSKNIKKMSQLPLSDEVVKSVELKDCTKPGTFFVEYTYKNEKFYAKYEVAAHHFNTSETVVVAKEDAALLNVSVVDGKVRVENTSCSKPVNYKVVLHCAAENCKCDAHTVDTSKFVELTGNSEASTCNKKVVSVTDMEAKPTGAHLLTEKAKKVDVVIKTTAKVRFSDLYDAAGEDKGVKFVVPENVCEKGGVVTVKYLCQRCGDVVKTQDVTVYSEAHKAKDSNDVENEAAATCTTKGHKDFVTRCKYCNAELSRVTVEEPKRPHTNVNATKDEGAYLTFVGDKVVDNNGALLKESAEIEGNYVGQKENGQPTEFGIYATVRTNCTACGQNEVLVTGKDAPALKLVSVKKQDAKGQNGTVTVKATYTLTDGKNAGKEISKEVTFPYWSSMNAYTGRTEPEVKDGLLKDKDGVYRYYVNGELQKDLTGVVDYAGNKYLIAAGELATSVNGLWYSEADKVWYFLVEGQVRTDYTGTALYDGQWFYVSNGKLDEAVTGLVPYNGGTFLFVEGRLRNDVSGLWNDVNNTTDWYFLALGQVQNQYSGVAQYDGGFFVVENGKLATNYNGTIEYDGATFKVVNGQLIVK